jgi:hypothetical protein
MTRYLRIQSVSFAAGLTASKAYLDEILISAPPALCQREGASKTGIQYAMGAKLQNGSENWHAQSAE